VSDLLNAWLNLDEPARLRAMAAHLRGGGEVVPVADMLETMATTEDVFEAAFATVAFARNRPVPCAEAVALMRANGVPVVGGTTGEFVQVMVAAKDAMIRADLDAMVRGTQDMFRLLGLAVPDDAVVRGQCVKVLRRQREEHAQG
jgi:hypothetical protein